MIECRAYYGVICEKAVSQANSLDSRLRGNDDKGGCIGLPGQSKHKSAVDDELCRAGAFPKGEASRSSWLETDVLSYHWAESICQ